MQKLFKLLLLVLLATAVVACGGGETVEEPASDTAVPADADTPAEEPSAEEPAAEEAEPEPTEAPAEEDTIAATDGQTLILATTTSTDDSGLLNFILPDFEAQTGVDVSVIAVGTGQALELGENGDADVLLVHARAREDAFMEAGHGVRREDVMYNDFVIVGPTADPAGILGRNRAARAFEQIAEAEADFVSRGDDSGTHTKEKAIWAEAGIEPAGDWYIAAGQGMGAVLNMSDELQAYTLTDRATYLARTLTGTTLEIMVEGDPILFNPYGVMAVNPDKGDHIQNDLANQFIDWLISVPTQEMIAEFGIEEFGAPLFTPDSQPWREEMGMGDETEEDAAAAEDAPIALRITGMVDTEQAWTEAEVQSLDTIEAQAMNNSGELDTYTGVPVNDLLALAGVQDGAATITFVTGDGETLEMTLEEISGCADCILSFRNQGGFATTFPGFDDLPRLRGVVEIQVGG